MLGASELSRIWASSSDRTFWHSCSPPSPGPLGGVGGRDRLLPRLDREGPVVVACPGRPPIRPARGWAWWERR